VIVVGDVVLFCEVFVDVVEVLLVGDFDSIDMVGMLG